MNADFDELVMRIIKASNLDRETILGRIDAKVTELSGLVSRLGAAHIVANTFGIQLNESKKGRPLELKEVVDGLGNITIRGIITNIFPIRNFEKDGRKGKVATVVINDGTDEARLVFWNESTEIVESGRINVNDFIKAHHLRSKKGNFGMELHVSTRSRIELNPEEKPPVVKQKTANPRASQAERFLICDLQEGVNATLRATLVQIYDRTLFYDICPECGKSAKEGKCATHGNVSPAKALMINGVFDDGTGSIKCVFFKQNAEALLGCSTEQALKAKEETREEAGILKDKKDLIGDEFMITGKVNKNSFNEQLEIMVNAITRADPLNEAKKLLSND